MREKDNFIKGFSNILRKNGIKVTPQRMAIYKELLFLKNHPYADMVYKRVREKFPSISFDTVNRTLLTFSKIGIVDIVEGYGEPKRFDINVDIHHHFRCIYCGKIIDIYNSYYDNIKIPTDIEKKFKVFKHRVIVEGICKECENKV